MSVAVCRGVRASMGVCVHVRTIYLSLWVCVFISSSLRLLERLGEEGVGWAVSRIVDIPGSASFSALIL